MAALTSMRSRSPQLGTSMIEVLVTLVITVLGLLGIAGLQYRVQLSDVESYQRSQAIVLLQDMAARISTNRNAAVTYVTTSPIGGTSSCPTTVGTRQEIDTMQWCHALQGAAELAADGTSRSGAMIGARGCVQALPNHEYMITVAWQGLAPVSAPPASVACGAGLYDGAGDNACINDLCRRVVTTVVRLEPLS